MLIKTIHELRVFLPSHAYKEIESRAGIFENSEQDFLLPLVGAPLLRRMNEYYATLPPNALVPLWEPDEGADPIDTTLPMVELLKRSQACIVYNAQERSIDRDRISLNNSGVNVISADGYDTTGKDEIKDYRDRMWRESHRAADRLLVYLEGLASKAPLASSQGGMTDGTDAPSDSLVSSGSPLGQEHIAQTAEIIALWKESKYYYLVDGLLINTASKMQEFIDIEDLRERFVQMLPDMRFIQRNYLRSELGAVLFDRLLAASRDGRLTDEEADIVYQLQQLLALYTQERSRVFKFTTEERKRIEEECIGLKRDLLKMVEDYRERYSDDGDPMAPLQSPQGGMTDGNEGSDGGGCECGASANASSDSDGRYWGDKGGVFVMPGII